MFLIQSVESLYIYGGLCILCGFLCGDYRVCMLTVACVSLLIRLFVECVGG